MRTGNSPSSRHTRREQEEEFERFVDAAKQVVTWERGSRERIVAAALRIPLYDIPEKLREKTWNGKPVYPEFLTVSAPPPARHHTLLHPLFHVIGHRTGPEDQGFLTSTGRYVGREEGLKIALASGKPMIDHPSRHPTQLFSEDLW